MPPLRESYTWQVKTLGRESKYSFFFFRVYWTPWHSRLVRDSMVDAFSLSERACWGLPAPAICPRRFFYFSCRPLLFFTRIVYPLFTVVYCFIIFFLRSRYLFIRSRHELLLLARTHTLIIRGSRVSCDTQATSGDVRGRWSERKKERRLSRTFFKSVPSCLFLFYFKENSQWVTRTFSIVSEGGKMSYLAHESRGCWKERNKSKLFSFIVLYILFNFSFLVFKSHVLAYVAFVVLPNILLFISSPSVGQTSHWCQNPPRYSSPPLYTPPRATALLVFPLNIATKCNRTRWKITAVSRSCRLQPSQLSQSRRKQTSPWTPCFLICAFFFSF